MVSILKDKQDVKKLKKILAERQAGKKFDAKKFCGILKVSEDALAIQLKLRDEWS